MQQEFRPQVDHQDFHHPAAGAAAEPLGGAQQRRAVPLSLAGRIHGEQAEVAELTGDLDVDAPGEAMLVLEESGQRNVSVTLLTGFVSGAVFRPPWA